MEFCVTRQVGNPVTFTVLINVQSMVFFKLFIETQKIK